MTPKHAIDILFDEWLPKAERWLENERDNPIHCLLLCYQSERLTADQAWNELPEHLHSSFPLIRAAMHRADDGRVLSIWLDGEQQGWRELLSAAGKLSLEFAELKGEAEAFNESDPIMRWALLMFTFAQNGAIEADVGGKRQNLDSQFQIQIGGHKLNSRFFIDNRNNLIPELQGALRESAIEYGHFAYMTDLRIATTSAIRSLRRGSIEAARKTRKVEDKTRNWGQYKKDAKSVVESQADDYGLNNAISATANCWCEILTHDETDPVYFGRHLALFFEWYHLAGTRSNDTVADGSSVIRYQRTAMNELCYIWQFLQNGPMADIQLSVNSIVDSSLVEQFRSSLIRRGDEEGLPVRPKNGIDFAETIDRTLFGQASSRFHEDRDTEIERGIPTKPVDAIESKLLPKTQPISITRETTETRYRAADIAKFLNVTPAAISNWKAKAEHAYPKERSALASEWREFVKQAWPNRRYDPERIPLQ